MIDVLNFLQNHFHMEWWMWPIAWLALGVLGYFVGCLTKNLGRSPAAAPVPELPEYRVLVKIEVDDPSTDYYDELEDMEQECLITFSELDARAAALRLARFGKLPAHVQSKLLEDAAHG